MVSQIILLFPPVNSLTITQPLQATGINDLLLEIFLLRVDYNHLLTSPHFKVWVD